MEIPEHSRSPGGVTVGLGTSAPASSEPRVHCKGCEPRPGQARSAWGHLTVLWVTPLPSKEGDQLRRCFGRGRRGHSQGCGAEGTWEMEEQINGYRFCWNRRLLQAVAPLDFKVLPLSCPLQNELFFFSASIAHHNYLKKKSKSLPLSH